MSNQNTRSGSGPKSGSANPGDPKRRNQQPGQQQNQDAGSDKSTQHDASRGGKQPGGDAGFGEQNDGRTGRTTR